MSLETRANNHYSPKTKKSRRSIQEDPEEMVVEDSLENLHYDSKSYEADRVRQERIHRREEFWSNLMDKVLVPLSVVALFCLYVYAEVNRATGY